MTNMKYLVRTIALILTLTLMLQLSQAFFEEKKLWNDDLIFKIFTDKEFYEVNEDVIITLVIINTKNEEVILEFTSSLIFDFEITHEFLDYKFKFSENAVSMPVLTNLTLDPNEEFKQYYIWKPPYEGVYNIEGEVVGYDVKASTKVFVEVMPAMFYPKLFFDYSVYSEKTVYLVEEPVKIIYRISSFSYFLGEINRNDLKNLSLELRVQIIGMFHEYVAYNKTLIDDVEEIIKGKIYEGHFIFKDLPKDVYTINSQLEIKASLEEKIYPYLTSSYSNFFIVLDKESLFFKSYDLKINLNFEENVNKESFDFYFILIVDKNINLEKLIVSRFAKNITDSFEIFFSLKFMNSVKVSLKEGEYIIISAAISIPEFTSRPSFIPSQIKTYAGYSLVNLDSSKEVNITLRSPEYYNYTTWNVKVLFKNGTPVENATVKTFNLLEISKLYGELITDSDGNVIINSKAFPTFISIEYLKGFKEFENTTVYPFTEKNLKGFMNPKKFKHMTTFPSYREKGIKNVTFEKYMQIALLVPEEKNKTVYLEKVLYIPAQMGFMLNIPSFMFMPFSFISIYKPIVSPEPFREEFPLDTLFYTSVNETVSEETTTDKTYKIEEEKPSFEIIKESEDLVFDTELTILILTVVLSALVATGVFVLIKRFQEY